MHISIALPSYVTPQLIAIVVAILIVLFLVAGITGRRHRRRRHEGASHRTGAARRSHARSERKDHGSEVARKHGTDRSPQWPRVAKEHLSREPACVACGHRGEELQVHHIKPFHLHPDLELDPDNLITLCEVEGREHHLHLGHLDEWESFNVHVRADAKRHHGKSAAKIRADEAWLKAVAKRP